MKPGLGFAFLVLLATPAAVHAGAQVDCRSSDMWDSRCGWRAVGAPSEAEIAARGEEVLRFEGGMSLRRYGSFMIELRRSRDGVVTLTARNPLQPSQAVSSTVAPSVWRRLVDVRERFVDADALDRMESVMVHGTALLRPPGAKDTEDTIVVCADGGGLSIDSVLHGQASHVVAIDCYTDLVDPLLDSVPDTLLPLLPGCAVLDGLRALCAALEGDRVLAGRELRNVLKDNAMFCEDKPPHEITVDGAADLRTGTANDGSGGAAQTVAGFRASACDNSTYFEPRQVRARGGALEVFGRVTHGRDQPGSDGAVHEVELTGPYRQVWRVDGAGLRLEKWTVGTLALAEDE